MLFAVFTAKNCRCASWLLKGKHLRRRWARRKGEWKVNYFNSTSLNSKVWKDIFAWKVMLWKVSTLNAACLGGLQWNKQKGNLPGCLCVKGTKILHFFSNPLSPVQTQWDQCWSLKQQAGVCFNFQIKARSRSQHDFTSCWKELKERAVGFVSEEYLKLAVLVL